MIDKRESILARLEVLLDTIPDILTVVRNRALLDNDDRPALVLLDGSELERAPRVGSNIPGRQAMTPVLVTMRPQIFYVPKSKLPQNETVGTDLNTFRAAIIAAVGTDATLQSLVGTNGDIVYNGCETDLRSGAPLMGQARLDFAFTYWIDPTN
jgi:hypothetical protein